MDGSPPEQNEAAELTLAQFLNDHSEMSGDGTASWSYRFNAKGHDVLMLVVSGAQSVELITAAAEACGFKAGVHETLH